MKWFSGLFLISYLFILGCKSLAPTPLQVSHLIELNNEVQELYLGCTTENSFNENKPGCDATKLTSKAQHARDVAKFFISSDIRQPHGYDIYLQITMIYFRVAERTGDEYSEAEKIAVQFFEVQKATSGRAINLARFYWATMTAEHVAWEIRSAHRALTPERRVELAVCAKEAIIAFEQTEDPILRARLYPIIQILTILSRTG